MPSLRESIAVTVLFTLFGGPGVLLVLVPWWITRFRIPPAEPVWQITISGLLIVAGAVPLLESSWRFVVVGRGTLVPVVPTEHLVVSGLYAYVRNPMYVGVLGIVAGEAILFRNSGLVIELVLGWLCIELFVRFYEEPRLAHTFPVEFAEYRRNVRRWLPRLTAWRPS